MVTRQIRRRRRQHSSNSDGDDGDDDRCAIIPSTLLLLMGRSSSSSSCLLHVCLILLLLFLPTTTITTCTGQLISSLSSSSSVSQSEAKLQSHSQSEAEAEAESIKEASTSYSIWRTQPVCFTGPSQPVFLNVIINNNENNDINRRYRGLRQLRTTDSSLNDFGIVQTNPAMIHHRGLSLDGSNSLTSTSSGNGNQDNNSRINSNNTITTTEIVYVRECLCFGDINDKIAFCGEESDYCGMSTKSVIDGGGGGGGIQKNVECYTVSKLDTVTHNIWPLIWLLYCLVLISCLCTFHGRVVLDFIKGTILYYFCGCGDRLGNRSLRSINRYNNTIVQEILDEEHYDRSQVLRTRRDGTTQAAQQMDAITSNANANANANVGATTTNNAATVSVVVPPTTVMTNNSIEMDNIIEDVDEEEQAVQDVSAATSTAPRNTGSMLLRFGNYFDSIVWPWQHSWRRYIRYNLLLRVEWIAQRDEAAFINSRQQRGLPHARYEMKIRKWNSHEGCTNTGDNSIAQFSHCSNTSSPNSVDEPHCTICFTELEDGDRVGDIGCMHVFHADCLKMWIQKRNSCPLCNIPVAKRRRISSEELDKEAIAKEANSNNNNNAAAATTAAAALLLQQEESDINSSGSTTANTSLAVTGDDHAHGGFQPTEDGTTPTRQRLLHIPMTPSTLAAEDSYDSYSSYSDEYAMNDIMDDYDDNSSIGGVNGSPSSGFTVSNDRKQSIDDGDLADDVEVKGDDHVDVVDDGNNCEALLSPDDTSTPDAAVDESLQQEQEQKLQPNFQFPLFQGAHLQLPPRQIRQRRSTSLTTRPQKSNDDDNDNIPTGHDGAVVGIDEDEEEVDDSEEEGLGGEEEIEDDLHHIEEVTNGDDDEEKEEEQQ